MMDVRDIVSRYFNEIDTSLETLSNLQEKHIANLPSWVLAHRRIQIVYVEQSDYYVVSAEPHDDLEEDWITQENSKSAGEIKLEAPWTITVPFGRRKNEGQWIGDVKLLDAENPFAEPAFNFRGIIFYGSADIFEKDFTVEKAKETALQLWHEAAYGIPRSSVSVVAGVQNLITRLRDVTKRKAFLERRVHRFLNANPQIFLPEHGKVYFEHPVYYNGEKLVADFILKRSHGQPALLIELENPVHNIFTKKGDLTKEANHARQQISDWVSFIRRNSDNVKGEMEFLSGPVERLIIMGRGLDRYEDMLETRYGDTLMWTYDVLAKYTVERWNRIIQQNCDILNIEDKGHLYRGKLN